MTTEEAYEIYDAFAVFVSNKRKILIKHYSLELLEEARPHIHGKYSLTLGYAEILKRIKYLKRRKTMLFNPYTVGIVVGTVLIIISYFVVMFLKKI